MRTKRTVNHATSGMTWQYYVYTRVLILTRRCTLYAAPLATIIGYLLHQYDDNLGANGTYVPPVTDAGLPGATRVVASSAGPPRLRSQRTASESHHTTQNIPIRNGVWRTHRSAHHVPQKTADFGNKESALSGRSRLGSVISTVPE